MTKTPSYSKRQTLPATQAQISCRPVAISDISLLSELYKDPVVESQLYKAPEEETDFSRWAISKDRFIFLNEAGEVLGTFTLVPSGYTATIGIAILEKFRRQGNSQGFMEVIENKAKELGYRTLCADIYSNNTAAISIFLRSDFHEVSWYEKNI